MGQPGLHRIVPVIKTREFGFFVYSHVIDVNLGVFAAVKVTVRMFVRMTAARRGKVFVNPHRQKLKLLHGTAK